jgi:hypothetical protein
MVPALGLQPNGPFSRLQACLVVIYEVLFSLGISRFSFGPGDLTRKFFFLASPTLIKRGDRRARGVHSDKRGVRAATDERGTWRHRVSHATAGDRCHTRRESSENVRRQEKGGGQTGPGRGIDQTRASTPVQPMIGFRPSPHIATLGQTPE